MEEQPEAGPSRLPVIRKPKAPHPDHRPVKRIKYPATLPPPPPSSHPTAKPTGQLQTLPNKVLQGRSTRRTETTKPGFGRDVIFVTRKVTLGALMGRCRSLLIDEGYTRITLFAITAAIPHAMLLLHALIDLLPYPKGPKGMWYEIRTGTTECVDEVDAQRVIAGEDGDDFEGIGAIEAEEPKQKVRLNSTIQIDLHITPRPPPKAEKPVNPNKKKKEKRPSKRQRQALLRKRQAENIARAAGEEGGSGNGDEEEMMNFTTVHTNDHDDDEEEEAQEEVEER